jgi:hypothetical protein
MPETVQLQISVSCKHSECEHGVMEIVVEHGEGVETSFEPQNFSIIGNEWICPDCEEPHTDIEVMKRIFEAMVAVME